MINGIFKKGDKVYFKTKHEDCITGIITGNIIRDKYEIKSGTSYYYQTVNKINLISRVALIEKGEQ